MLPSVLKPHNSPFTEAKKRPIPATQSAKEQQEALKMANILAKARSNGGSSGKN